MKQLCEDQGITFENIQNKKDALEARLNHVHTKQGVFILNRSLARGYDLKLKVDPLVMVLVNDEHMSKA